MGVEALPFVIQDVLNEDANSFARNSENDSTMLTSYETSKIMADFEEGISMNTIIL